MIGLSLLTWNLKSLKFLLLCKSSVLSLYLCGCESKTLMINKEVKGIIMLGHQIQMFGLIMINKEVKGIIMLGHQYKCLVWLWLIKK